MGVQFPVLHILGMVDGNAGKPFKSGNCHVIIIALAADARIRIKTRENRILSIFISSFVCEFLYDAVIFLVQLVEQHNNNLCDTEDCRDPDKGDLRACACACCADDPAQDSRTQTVSYLKAKLDAELMRPSVR